jgi:hypothetical protein
MSLSIHITLGATMQDTEIEPVGEDRGEELLAIINMIGYAMGITRELGIDAAASDLAAARLKLITELQQDLVGTISGDDIVHLANFRSGHC